MPGVVLAAMVEISVGSTTRAVHNYMRGETSVLRGRCFYRHTQGLGWKHP